MLISGVLLLLLAAIMHALTNVLMKRSRDKLAFAWWMLGVYCVLASPTVFFLPQVEPVAWRFVVLSGVLEAVYFIALTKAYTSGDLSFVYPIARGSAPLFVLLWAMLFLKERPSPAGVLGILIVVAGLYLIHLPSMRD